MDDWQIGYLHGKRNATDDRIIKRDSQEKVTTILNIIEEGENMEKTVNKSNTIVQNYRITREENKVREEGWIMSPITGRWIFYKDEYILNPKEIEELEDEITRLHVNTAFPRKKPEKTKEERFRDKVIEMFKMLNESGDIFGYFRDKIKELEEIHLGE